MSTTLERAVDLFGMNNVRYLLRDSKNSHIRVTSYLEGRATPPVDFLEKVVQAVDVYDVATELLGDSGLAMRFMYKAVDELGGGPYECIDAGEYMNLRAYMNKHSDDLLRGDYP